MASLLPLVLLMVWLFGRHSQVGNSLRAYRAGLIAQGEKLTFAELTSSYAPHTNNAHQVLSLAVTAMGAQKFVPGGLELRKYIAPGQARPILQQNPPFWSSARGSRPGGTWEEFAAELDRIQQPLQQLRDALKDPEPDAGPFTNIWARRIDFVKIRTASQWLMGATLSEARLGHLEQSLENLEALAGVARLDRDEFTLVAQMIRSAVTELGTTTTWELLQVPGWTDPQLLRLQRAWEQVDLLAGLEHAMVGERAFGEEFWLQAHQSNNSNLWANLGFASSGPRTIEEVFRQHLLFPLYKAVWMDQDLLFRLQTMQESVLLVRSLEHGRTWPEARQVADQLVSRVNGLAKSPQRYRYWFSMLSIANCSRAAQTVARYETERQMTLAAIALLRFQLQQQRYPARLQELVPAYLSQLPYDPMSGKPLCYQLKTNGQFLLYSVGEDGVDNGGDAQVAKPGAKPELWEGKDAVWPQALPPK